MDLGNIGWGAAAGLATGVATFIGALPLLFVKRPSAAGENVLLGFAAGVMLSASYLSLIVPAAQAASGSGFGPFSSAAIVALSVLVGALCLHWLRRSDWLSRMSVGKREDTTARRLNLLLVAMTAHNLPEGAAVGVGFGAGDWSVGVGTAIGIGVQNLPEGLAVAAALLAAGYSRRSAVLVSGLTGLVEPVGALLAASLVALATSILPAAMGWAAGAMLYIVSAELIPAVHENGDRNDRAIAAVVVGLAAMAFLDIALAAPQ